jgi:hypothetical protein
VSSKGKSQQNNTEYSPILKSPFPNLIDTKARSEVRELKTGEDGRREVEQR